ncbi:MAG: hypothetical protein ACTHKY_21455 [Ginsengibacter sp.]|jgi:hypothetical protein
MKKLLFFIAISLLFCSIAFAQREGRTRFSLGAELGLATSNPLSVVPGNKGWGVGIGASAEAEHFYKQNLSGTGYIGVISYVGRSAGTNTKNKAYRVIPVRVGGNLYAGNLHLGAQIGVGLNSMSGTSATAFAYTPQIGYNFSRNEKPLDLTLKYDGYAGNGNFGAFGLRLSIIL